MSKKNKEFAEALRGIADMVDRETVTIKDSNVKMSAGHVSGVDLEHFQCQTHHRDGNFTIDLHLEFYDPEKDKRRDAYDPIDNIRSQIN